MWQEIKDIIEKEEYECYGVRTDYEAVNNVGDICRNSHQWWQDDPEDGSEYNEEMHAWDGGELSGTCALEITADEVDDVMKKLEMYFGDNISLIAGDVYEGGNDIGEVIISNAKVLWTAKR